MLYISVENMWIYRMMRFCLWVYKAIIDNGANQWGEYYIFSRYIIQRLGTNVVIFYP